jgi:phosphoglycolate phosphatase-like HAD superfamily hydrolase
VTPDEAISDEGTDDEAISAYAVLDIDGVLADVTHRLHHIESRPKDWRAFFGAAGRDPVQPEGRAVADELAESHTVVYLTGRPEYLRRTTHDWLRRNGLPAGRLLMRERGDFRPARAAKLEILRNLETEAPVAVVVDDDDEVVVALRSAGFNVFHATWGRPAEALREAQEREGRT